MRRYRGLLVALGSAVIAAGALTAPVAAVDPRLALVNGIPGRTVDVCVGTNEVRSNLRYGGWVERFVGPGSRTVRFRAAAPGTCTGEVLAQTVLLLAEDDDKTVVGTRQVPNKVVVFENLPYVATTLADIEFRHAGDLGPVNVVQSFASPSRGPRHRRPRSRRASRLHSVLCQCPVRDRVHRLPGGQGSPLPR